MNSYYGRHINPKYDQILCPHMGVDGEPLKEGEHANIAPLICSVFDAVRERWGSPLLVTAGIRCAAYQAVLKEKGYRTAEVSPHCYGVALDVVPKDVITGVYYQVEDDTKIKWVQKLSGIIHEVDPDIRIFCARYGFDFVHLDCGYLLPDPLPDGRLKPEAWKAGVRDWP